MIDSFVYYYESKQEGGINKDIIIGLKSRDRKYQEIFYKEYKDKIYSFIYRMVGNETISLDLTADVFLRVFEKIDKYDEEKSFNTWVFTVAHNIVIDFFRKDSRKMEIETKEGLSLEEKVLLEISLMKLRKEEKEVLMLKYIEGFSVKEIGEIMNLNENTVKTLLKRGRDHLRIIIGEEEL